jgi:hypothetical protein
MFAAPAGLTLHWGPSEGLVFEVKCLVLSAGLRDEKGLQLFCTLAKMVDLVGLMLSTDE